MNLALLWAQAENAGQGGLGPLPMLVIMMVAAVLFLFLPMRRQHKQHQQMLAGLKRNDRVVTSGGLVGVVVDIRDRKEGENRDDELVLRVDDQSNTRVRVLKSSVVRVYPATPEG
jgi:preprotein translocase subunit YajC